MPDTGRTYARRYEAVRRGEDHEFVASAVARAGGRVVFSSGPSTAPLFLGVEGPSGERVGLTAYVFHANRKVTKNRPTDEHRGQVRYGDPTDAAWRNADHPLGWDPARVDLTLVLMAHPDADLLIALDPFEYDPLPIGNSLFFKDAEIDAARASGWHVWERLTRSGRKKGSVDAGIETVIGLKPERLFDLLAVERQSQTLGLDQALRYRVAEAAATGTLGSGTHELEGAFELSSSELLDIIGRNRRLAVAVRGGVAEHHLGVVLERDPMVASARAGTTDGPPDFHVTLGDGRPLTIECKNASPTRYADGTAKVETQKTRASKGDPASRFYPIDAFDLIAACMYGPTKRWTFKFCRSDRLVPHPDFEDRIAPIQRITSAWRDSVADALDVA